MPWGMENSTSDCIIFIQWNLLHDAQLGNQAEVYWMVYAPRDIYTSFHLLHTNLL